MLHMKYDVVIKRKVAKGLRKLPVWVQKKMAILAEDLREKGPEQIAWQNYSKLSQTEYHCHLGTSWVACWRHQSRTIIIEVYYVGSREKAPY
jgi:mRNA-degrading endonuclease RelE of RelBE toxin-antitoxin system